MASLIMSSWQPRRETSSACCDLAVGVQTVPHNAQCTGNNRHKSEISKIRSFREYNLLLAEGQPSWLITPYNLTCDCAPELRIQPRAWRRPPESRHFGGQSDEVC